MILHLNCTWTCWLWHTYQSEWSQNRHANHICQKKFHQAWSDNDSIKNIPSLLKVMVWVQSNDLEHHFSREDAGEYLLLKKKKQIYWPFIYFITILQKIHFQYFTFYSPLTTFPTISILLKLPDIGWCSMAINNVFSTMQMVMVKSVNGSITISLTTFLIFSHAGQHSQMRKIWAKLYQHGGHFCLDSSSSDDETNKQKHLKVLFIFSIPKLG